MRNSLLFFGCLFGAIHASTLAPKVTTPRLIPNNINTKSTTSPTGSANTLGTLLHEHNNRSLVLEPTKSPRMILDGFENDYSYDLSKYQEGKEEIFEELGFWWEKDGIEADGICPFARGSHGAVYRAKIYSAANQTVSVAVKVLESKKQTLEERRKEFKSFHREVAIQRSIKSEWVVQLLKVMERTDMEKPQMAIIMEDAGVLSLMDLYGSKNVENVVDEKRGRFERVSYLGYCISRGIAACHQHGILHRDVALKNVIVSMNGTVRLCDFGLSTPVKSGVKVTGGAGTPRFMSRRAILGKPYGIDTDYYSLGACIFALDQLKEPLEGVIDDLEEFIKWHARGELLSEQMNKAECDPRVIEAVRFLCDQNLGNEQVVQNMALFRRCPFVAPPQSVMKDIEKIMAL